MDTIQGCDKDEKKLGWIYFVWKEQTAVLFTTSETNLAVDENKFNINKCTIQ